MKFIYTIVISLLMLPLIGQSDCSIKVANEVSDDIIVRSGAVYTQDIQDVQWALDSDQATLSLDPGEESSLLSIDRFNVDIPEGSDLLGVSIMVRGSAEGGNISDRIISFSTDSGDSANFSNFVSFGESWDEKVSTWTYGTSYNLLSGPITVDDLRSDNYNINIKIANTGVETSEVTIKDVRMLVRYRRPYTVCPDHLCVIFFVPDVNTASNYNWSIPEGFDLLDNQNGVGIVGINVQDGTENGIYEICVDEVTSSGIQDQCCRTFALGDCQPNSLGDAVYIDDNQNGVFDADESGIPSVTLNLLDDENNLIATTQTDGNGNYRFTNLDDGFYQIEVDYDGTLSPSFGSSFSEFFTGLKSEIFYLQGSQFDDGFDFGFFAQFAIDGIVWTDDNCNGLRDNIESPLAGLPVILFDGGDNLVATTLSDSDGYYEFSGLTADTYSVWLSGFDADVFEPTVLLGTADGNALTIVNGAFMTEEFSLTSNTTKNLGISAFSGVVQGSTFIDANGDNLGLGETRQSGVGVILWSCDGKLIESMQTDTQGNYSFTKVPIGDYYVEFGSFGDFNTQDATTTVTPGNNDITSANGLNTTDCFTVTEDAESIISAGYFAFASIGDYVWEDRNQDGLQGGDELGLNGAIVQLYQGDGILVEETLSNAGNGANEGGFYTFDQLVPGEYYLQIITENSSFSPSNANDLTLNSDITGQNGDGTTSTFTILSGEDNRDIDFGIISNVGQISGYIFDDVSADGFSSDEDFGIGNITITASSSIGLEYTAITDENGNYTLQNLADGDYTLSIEIDEVYNLTTPNVVSDESDDTNDSDYEGAGNVATLSVTLVNGAMITDVDAGFFRLGSISGVVWIDENQNGIREENESLTDAYTVIVRGDIPDQELQLTDGMYTASNLIPGTYNLLIETPINVIFSPSFVGNDATVDSDIDITMDIGGSTRNIFIESGTVVSDIDGGLYVDPNLSLTGTLSGTIFLDNMADGLLVGDAGLSGIEVTLLDSNGEIIESQVTADNGKYLFDNLDLGTYTLMVDNQDFNISPTDVGTNNSIDSDFVFNGASAMVLATVTSVNASKIYDLGLFELGVISGNVWFDTNSNGIREADDVLLESYVVALNTGTTTQEMLTDANGAFRFDNLPPGVYNISTTAEGDVAFTMTLVGADTAIDSDIANISGVNGSTTNIFINSGTQVDDIGIGLIPIIQDNYSIVGTLFNDVAADGLQSDGDLGESLVDLILFDQNENFVASTLTDESGNYAFNDLTAGVYILRIVTTRELTIPNAGNDDLVDSDFGNVSGLYQVDIILSNDELVVDIDGGLYGLGTINGLVWEDADEDGIRSDAEEILIDQEVRLLDSGQNIIASVNTTVDGYSFDGLLPSIYSIQYVLNGTFAFTQVNAGLDTTRDSDIINIDGDTGRTGNQFIFSDSVRDNVDIGLTHNAIGEGVGSISGVIFEDLFANNIQDSDPGIQFISVNLVDSSGDLIATQVTDSIGGYTFANLPAGEYNITYQVPEIYTLSLAEASNNEVIDVDFVLDGQMAVSEAIVLDADSDVTDVDSGMWRAISISGVLWNDLNENGIRDLDEPVLADYPVSLYEIVGGELITMTTTTAMGYLFDDIAPGFYFVGFPLGDDEVLTQVNVGNDDTVDSEFQNSTGDEVTSGNLFIESGTDRGNIDGGLILGNEAPIMGQVTGTIFEDAQADGIQDGDIGVEGVILNLISIQTGTIVQSVSSTPTGEYTFDNVLMGAYFIELELPDNYVLTQTDTGMDDTVDSDFIANSNGGIGSDVFNIDTNGMVVDVDAGLYRLGTLSGQVWIDDNQDGIRNLDDAVAGGFVVNLLQDGMVVQSAVSTEMGYQFDSVAPGIYSVGLDLNTTLYQVTSPQQGTDPTLDSDIVNVNQPTVTTGNLFIQSGSVIEHIGIGLIALEVDMIDMVINTDFFEDLNGDGLNFEQMPYPIDEVTIMVAGTNGGMIFASQTFTEVSAVTNWSVSLIPGTYELIISPFATLTQQDIGSNEDRDSDFSVSGDGSYRLEFTVDGLSTQYDYTLGVYEAVTISGRAWNDTNMNGLQDEGQEQTAEAGVAGVTIILNNGAGMAVATTTTMMDGEYRFEGLAPDNYRIGTLLPEGRDYTVANAGSDEIDSDIALFSGINGSSALVSLMSGEQLTTLDIGVIGEEEGSQAAIITGGVWEDLNGNGQIDLIEPLINDVTVRLHDQSSGIVVAETVTADSPVGVPGFYTFEVTTYDDDYFISFVFADDDISITEPFSGSSELRDSDVTEENGDSTTDLFEIAANTEYNGINFGYYYEASIGDFVWLDENQNGIQDDTEPGLNDIQVVLIDENGNMIDSAFTSTEDGLPGHYAFTEVDPGTYIVAVNSPDDLEVTSVGAGSNGSVDNDINPNTQRSAPIAVTSGAMETTIDIGLTEGGMAITSVVGDQVFIDSNGDNVYNQGEEGLNDVQVQLYTEDGDLVAMTTTANVNGLDGKYAFDGVNSGKYYIVFVPGDSDFAFVKPNEGNSDAMDSDVTEEIQAGATNIFTVTTGVEELDIDAGVFLSASIGNYVWEDTNQNGIQEPSEAGQSGVDVELYTVSGDLLQTVESNTNGFYLFNGIQPGDYYVRFVLAGSVAITEQSVGDDLTIDSDANSAGLTEIFTIVHGQSNFDIDAGVYSTVALINGRAWLDTNENGSQDFGENGMEGVEVELLDDNGNVVDKIYSDLLGNYTFADLDLDRYIIRFVQPKGYEFSESQFFLSDEENSDVDKNGMTPILNLAVDATRYHIDAGLMTTTLNAQNYQVSVYPNPAVNSVQISVEGTSITDDHAIITVYDQLGREVITQSLDMHKSLTTRLDISQLRSGIYQVYIDSNGRLGRQPLIIID